MKRVLFCLSLYWNGWCQPLLTPRQAVQSALEIHPTLRQQAETVLAARERGRRVESDLYPHLSLEAVVKDGPPGAPNFRLPGLANAGFAQSGGGDLVLSQTFDFGRTSQAVSAEEFASLSEQHRHRALQEQLAWQVLRAYGQLCLAQQQVRLGEDSARARSEMARQADAHFRAGLVSRVDSSLARADWGQAQADLIELQSQEKTAWSTLYTAMGQPLAASAELPALHEPGPTLEEWKPSLQEDLASLTARPEFQSAQDQVNAQQARVGAAQAGANPSLSVYAAGGYIANLNGPASSPNNYGVGAALSWPLFTAGGVEAEVGQAEHRLAAAQAAEQEILQRLQGQLQAARVKFQSLCQRRAALDQQLAAAEDGWKLARTRYRLGLGAILELQQAELARLRALNALARNRAEIWQAWVDLEYLTGHLLPDFAEEGKL
jgi:multidrug efflux system outer membrane protein